MMLAGYLECSVSLAECTPSLVGCHLKQFFFQISSGLLLSNGKGRIYLYKLTSYLHAYSSYHHGKCDHGNFRSEQRLETMTWVNWGQLFCCYIKFITNAINMCSGLGNPFPLWHFDILCFRNVIIFFSFISISSRSNTKNFIKTVEREHRKCFWQLVSDYMLNWLGLYLFHYDTRSHVKVWSTDW